MTLLSRTAMTLIISATVFCLPRFSCASEQVVVVISQNNDLRVIDKKGLIDLFMGKYSAFPNGELATPIDVGLDTELKTQFYKQLVGLPLARVNAYWSRLKFSGRAKPPSIEQTIDDIQHRLERDKSALAYIYLSNVTDKMRVVYRFD